MALKLFNYFIPALISSVVISDSLKAFSVYLPFHTPVLSCGYNDFCGKILEKHECVCLYKYIEWMEVFWSCSFFVYKMSHNFSCSADAIFLSLSAWPVPTFFGGCGMSNLI